MSGCHDSLDVPEEEDVSAETERTVIIYMAAQNSLGQGNFSKDDLAEMVEGKASIPANVRVIVYLDDYNLPAIYQLSAKQGLQLWKQYSTDRCSTDSLTMLETLREIIAAFPAHHYGLTFWSHASGWVLSQRRNAFGTDPTLTYPFYDKEMNIPVMAGVLAELPKMDFLFFDACFMQSIEVAYELRNVTEWMVGSPAEIPGPGAPYDQIMASMCQGDAKGIAETYGKAYPLKNSDYIGVLLSCIDCEKLDQLAETTGRLLTPHYMNRTEPDTVDFQPYCKKVDTYCYDMRTTMCRLLTTDDYNAWLGVYNQAVPLQFYSPGAGWYSDTFSGKRYLKDPSCYGGVSMYVPAKEFALTFNIDFQTTAWYKACGWDATEW